MIPHARPYWRSASLRLTLLAAAVFALSTGLLLAYAYGAASVALARLTDRALRAEMAVLVAAYESKGLNGLNREVVQRSASDGEISYLLAYPDGSRISGQPDRMPDAALTGQKTVRFSFDLATGAGEDAAIQTRRARGHVRPLAGGYWVMTWRDVEEDGRALQSLTSQAWAIVALVLALGVGSGSLLSRRFIRRVDGLNAVAHGVSAGDLTLRARRTGSGDELDTLSANLNDMLDRIQRLMTAMRHAGDSIAHDLRSPLTRLRARLEAALMDESVPRDEALAGAIAGADEVLATFNAVMSLARLESGERRAALEATDLSALGEELAELYQPVCEDAEIEFISEIAPGLDCRADRMLVAQALANLLDNAVKYTPAGGAIAFRLRRSSAGEMEFSVTDTGPGIPAADRERVKDRFVRLDASRSLPGVGLGLALVAAVAAHHRGRLVLEDGPGSTSGSGAGLRAVLVLPCPSHAGSQSTFDTPA